MAKVKCVSGHYHIFVGDLSPDVETHQLREAFAPFGQTTYVYLKLSSVFVVDFCF